MSGSLSFTCTDCGRCVVNFIQTQASSHCAVCTFIRGMPDARDRAEARAKLYDAAEMRYWAAFGASRDETASP